MAKKPVAPEQLAELTLLRDRMMLTFEFMELDDPRYNAERDRAIVIQLFEAQDLRRLKIVGADVEEMKEAMTAPFRKQLDGALKERLGINVEAEREMKQLRVAAILKRGRVASEKERVRLERYVELLEMRGGDPDVISAVVRLLASG